MNKQELTEFIDRITQGRKLELEVIDTKRVITEDFRNWVDVINVEAWVEGEEYEFHFCTDIMIDWAVAENLHLFEWFGNWKEMSRTDWINLVEDESLIRTTQLFLNEIR